MLLEVYNVNNDFIYIPMAMLILKSLFFMGLFGIEIFVRSILGESVDLSENNFLTFSFNYLNYRVNGAVQIFNTNTGFY